MFQGLPVLVPITPYVEIDFEAVTAFDFSNNYLTLPESGEFYERNNHKETPYAISSLPDLINQQMVQMIISDFVPTSAGFTFWQLGQLAVNITNSMLPPWCPVSLNTTAFKELLPQLYNKYPDAAMVLGLSAEAMPIGIFTPSGVQIFAYGYGTIYVIQNGQYINAFVLNGTASASGKTE